jgi:chromosome segregation ATPase
VLGGALDAFIVSHKEDQLRLSGLMSRVRFPDRKINIFISRPGRSLGNTREPDESFETILRVLKFDDERVKNQLIITNHIEQILLVPDRYEGERIMFDHKPPPNAHSCLSFHDTKKGQGIILSQRGGNFSSSPVSIDGPNQPIQKPRMKSDTEYQINHQKEILAQLQSELRDLESSRRQLQQVAQKCSRAVTDHKKKAQKLDLDIRQAELAVRNAEEELDEFDGLDMKLQGLREELRVAEEKEEHYGKQYGGLAVVKEEHNKAVSAARKTLADAKAECGDFRGREAKAEDKVNRYEAVRRTVLAEKNGAYEDLAVGEEAKKKAERTRDRQLEVLEDHTEGAARVCPERVYIPEGESYPSIERKYNAVREQLRKFHESIGLTKEQASDQLADARQECTDAEKGQKNLLSLMVLLKKALITRLDKWRMFQRMISASARVNFEYLLSERGFRGRLLLDHKAKKLDIKVEPDETRKNMSGRNTKTLSGGEKSFSSICLLLAIWDAMGSPLRCLDEFDVFMDQVNRGISTKMLVSCIRSTCLMRRKYS